MPAACMPCLLTVAAPGACIAATLLATFPAYPHSPAAAARAAAAATAARQQPPVALLATPQG
eukprot:1158392-Pelagomonas_calceolata.AAC.19